MASKKIMKVLRANITIYKTKPPVLCIDAAGTVPTGGWTNGRLVPYIYVTFPTDGIWDFDFVADEPAGIVTQVISVISATYVWPDYPAGLKGVRIHSSTNKLEELIGKTVLIETE